MARYGECPDRYADLDMADKDGWMLIPCFQGAKGCEGTSTLGEVWMEYGSMGGSRVLEVFLGGCGL